MAKKKDEKIIMVPCNNGLHRAFKAKCAEQGRSMSSMIRFIVASYLDANPPGQVSDRSWAIYLEHEKREQFKYL